MVHHDVASSVVSDRRKEMESSFLYTRKDVQDEFVRAMVWEGKRSRDRGVGYIGYNIFSLDSTT